MEDLWRRLEAWGKAHGGKSLRMRDAASEEDIRLAEGTMEVKLPKDFREHLLWHDGQKRGATLEWLAGAPPLQPLDAIVARWQEEGGGQRIPIAGSETWEGRVLYLDAESGALLETDADGKPRTIAPSLRAAVEPYVQELERRGQA